MIIFFPQKLYRYSSYKWLCRSIKFGEFRLAPASSFSSPEHIKSRRDEEINKEIHFSNKEVTISTLDGVPIKHFTEFKINSSTNTDYLMLCFSRKYEDVLFDEFQGSDACLIVHDIGKFSDRIHEAFEKLNPGWAGVDAPIEYGVHSPLGAAFRKAKAFEHQAEYRFVWNPPQPTKELKNQIITIGNLEDICELSLRKTQTSNKAHKI